MHSDLLSSSLSCQSAPHLEPGPTGGAMPSRRVQEGPALSLWARPVFTSSENPSMKECVTSTLRKPRPLKASQVEGKGPPWRQSEVGSCHQEP